MKQFALGANTEGDLHAQLARISGRILGPSEDWTTWSDEWNPIMEGYAQARGMAPEAVESHLPNEGTDAMQQFEYSRITTTQRSELRLIKSGYFDLTSAYKRTAAMPLGTALRDPLMSPTAPGDNRSSLPISASVIGSTAGGLPALSAETASDQSISFIVNRNLRPADPNSNGLPFNSENSVAQVAYRRQAVTESGQNPRMTPRDSETEKWITRPGSTIGERVRYWRKALGHGHQGKFAKAIKGPDGKAMSQGALSDLENGRSESSEYLPYIARQLKVRLDYLTSGKGSALEGEAPAEDRHDRQPMLRAAVVKEESWPFPNITRSQLERICNNEVDMHFLESAMLDALAKIENSNRRRG